MLLLHDFYFSPPAFNFKKAVYLSWPFKGHPFITFLKRQSVFVLWSRHLISFFITLEFFWRQRQTNRPVYLLRSKVNLAHKVIAFRREAVQCVHHAPRLEKVATWHLQTGHSRGKLFHSCCHSKAPMTGAVELVGILQSWHQPMSTRGGHWPFPAPPLALERWLQKHHHLTQALQRECCPFITSGAGLT